MKKTVFIVVITLYMLTIMSGCTSGMKQLFLPEAENDELYTVIGGADGPTSIFVVTPEDVLKDVPNESYQGDGYSISIPIEGFYYEKEVDDGVLEETWESTSNDHAELKVSTYKNTSDLKAQSAFLKENEDFIFEDLLGHSICGFEADGDDVLWFQLYNAGEDVYIVSWEYSTLASDNSSKILPAFANTFMISE